MKKYIYIIKMVILDKFQYIYNQLFKMVMYAVFIFVFLQLWQYMYSDTQTIAGYSLNQMIWYFSVTEMLWGGIRPKALRAELSDDIKSGKIAYVLNKPFNYIGYLMSKYIGETLVNFTMYALVGTLISYILVGPLFTFSLISIPFIIISIILSIFITGLIYIIISLTSFWLEENLPFVWVYEKIILCVGILFPIEIFPETLRIFIKFSPIFVTTYAPAKLTVDFSFAIFSETLIFQISYLIILSIICTLFYRKGVKKINVNGG